MEKILNKPLSKIEQYSTSNKEFLEWIAKEISKDDNSFDFYRSNKQPWEVFDLILKKTVNSDEYWYIFKVVPADIAYLEFRAINSQRAKILNNYTSLFQNCKSFIFIFITDTNEYPIDLNINKFKQSNWANTFTANILVNSQNGTFTQFKVPARFVPGIDYFEKKLLQHYMDENDFTEIKTEETTLKPITTRELKSRQKKFKQKSQYQYGTYLPLKLKKEQQLTKLKGILKVHSKAKIDFIAQKLDSNRTEIESLIYEASGKDQLDIIMIDNDTIALKKVIARDLKPNLSEKTITENLDRLSRLEKCMICKKEIESWDEVAVCPHCANSAHKSEFLEWIKIKQKCPVCKKKLQAEELMIKAKK